MHFYIACAAVLVIAPLQRYAVAYGYEGETKREARRQALRVLGIVAIPVACVILTR